MKSEDKPRLVHEAVPLDGRHSLELRGHDLHAADTEEKIRARHLSVSVGVSRDGDWG